jgi:class 3 adenylate cyclase
VHSTAGDGVTVAFEDPKQGYAGARALLAGLFEFNAFRNRIGKPIELRAGLHTGSVLAPGQDIKSVNFAHVIDIAAHMQKAAPIGCLAVSDATATYLPGGKNTISSETIEAQDVRGTIWRPRSKVAPEAIVS